jgi:hypothetical protein
MSLGEKPLDLKPVIIETSLPETIDGILAKVREILMLGGIQALSLSNDGIIHYERLAMPTGTTPDMELQNDFTSLSIMDIVRRIPMEELEIDRFDPETQLVRIMLRFPPRYLSPTHIVMGLDSQFWRWLDLEHIDPKLKENFLNCMVIETADLPADIFLVCGAKSRYATIAELKYVIKGNIVFK